VKRYLETAPCLIGVSAQRHGITPDGGVRKHYYVAESVGIAAGFLLAALHHAGLATLTPPPRPRGVLNGVRGRPPHEKPMMLVVAGHPAADARVPRLTRKPLEEITSFH